jgi:hypothetical protein
MGVSFALHSPGQPRKANSMLRANLGVISVLWLTAYLAFPSNAQQPPPSPPPSSPEVPGQPNCDAFGKTMDGDWIAKRDITLPGPSGPVLVKAGTVVDGDMQDELDDRCK